MKKIILALAVMVSGFTLPAQNTKAVLNNYIGIKNALVNGDSKTASQSAAALVQSIKTTGDLVQKEALLREAENMAKAGTLESQRASFNSLSAQMWKAVKESKDLTEPVYYQYCSMKKGYWLSKDKEIKNPYYGSSMLTCGKTIETK